MKDFPPLSEFLCQVGVTKDTPREDVEVLKKEYARAYQAWYHKHERKQTTHRYTLRFSKSEWAELKQSVKRYATVGFSSVTKQTDLASFIKKSVLAYLSKQYLPLDPRPMLALQQELRVVGNMLSQVVDGIARLRRQNRLSGSLNDENLATLGEQYASLQNLIWRLEQRFVSFMQSPPPTLKQALKESLHDRPDKVGQLIEYLLTIKEQTDAGNKKHVTEG